MKKGLQSRFFSDKSMISAIVLTKNSAKTLEATLRSLSPFADVVVYDTGSEDDTLQIARTFPYVRIEQGPFLGFGATHNEAAKRALFDWILSIDSDEVVSQQLCQEILSLSLDPRAVYQIYRRNFFNGKETCICDF